MLASGVDIDSELTLNGCKHTPLHSRVTHCTSLPNANLGTKTFGDCVSFMSIKVPVGFVSLGEHAFYGCSSLTSIQLFDVNSSLTWQGEAGEAVLRCT